MSDFIRGVLVGASIATLLLTVITTTIIANRSELRRYKEGQQSILRLLDNNQLSLHGYYYTESNEGNFDEK